MIKLAATKSVVALAALAAIGAGAGVSAIASAQSVATPTTETPARGGHMAPGVMGTVSAITGNSMTVTGKNKTTYTVDITNAKFLKGGAKGSAPTTVSNADIKVGDMVMVRGTVTGTTVTATEVLTGMPQGGMMRGGRGHGVQGTVTSVSGSTVTITNSDGTSYTIDASKASVSKTVSIAVSDIKVGDTIGAEGTLSGTSVSATRIMDGIPPAPAHFQKTE